MARVEKLQMREIKPRDWKVMHDAVFSYLQALFELYESEKKAQQLIHYSILDEFTWELHKRIYGSKPPENGSISFPYYVAFPFFDALSYYSNQCDNHLESAVLNRIMISLHQELPRTSDAKKLSIHSELNFNTNANS